MRSPAELSQTKWRAIAKLFQQEKLTLDYWMKVDSCLFDSEGDGRDRQAVQTLEGSFSVVPTPKFAIKLKASFDSSRRDLHNTRFYTDIRSQRFN